MHDFIFFVFVASSQKKKELRSDEKKITKNSFDDCSSLELLHSAGCPYMHGVFYR